MRDSAMLAQKARWLRRRTFEMAVSAGQGHLASVLSAVEILVALYYGGVMRVDPDDPHRDRLIVSKGHATMGVYPILADLGFFPESEIEKYATPYGLLRLFGNISIPGIDATTGSLGHGLGIATGFCWAAKQDGAGRRTYVLLSEGEMYEGSTWESALFAAHHGLDNLCVILDRNRKIILGDTEDMLRLDPVGQKWESFGWSAVRADGHDFDSLDAAFSLARDTAGRPAVIVAETVKGKGISFMEGDPRWHYTTMNADEIARARLDLTERPT